MTRIAKTILLVIILISLGLFWLPSECKAQKRMAAPEYDYYSLAITSISNSAAEASKLPDVPQRVKLLLNAAKILPTSEHDEAVRLLEICLSDLKAWGSDDRAGWYERHTAATLRNQLLADYAIVDPEKASALQKEFQAEAKTTSESEATLLRHDDWYTQFRDRETIANQAAKIAFSLVDTDPEKALGLVLQSLQGGIVSRFLVDIVQKLIQNGNRAFLNELQTGIGQVLAGNVTLHWSSLSYAAAIVKSDQDMPIEARNAFLNFFMRSLRAWSSIVRDPSGNAGVDTLYISLVYTMFSLNVRPVILQYSPRQIFMFDSVLDQVEPLVPEKTKSSMHVFQPETFLDPRDQLIDILKDPSPEKRDLRLVGLVSGLLRNESRDFQKRFDVASDAISGFSDPDVKAAYTDLLTISRIDVLVKQKKFIEAQHLAQSISSEETRAWAFLALSSIAAKADQVLGFELISNALRALDRASPSPHKVELALVATAMFAKKDPERAFDTLSATSRYANSSVSKVDPPTKPPVAFGLEATIGEAHTKIGVFPETLGEVEINPSLSLLGTTDWFRANQIVNDIHELSLRLQLKLQFAAAVIAAAKPKREERARKSPAKN